MKKIRKAIKSATEYIRIIKKLSFAIKRLMILAVFLSLILFLVEVFFAWAIQYFLSSIGILAIERTFILPVLSKAWGGFAIFFLAGILRSIALSLRTYFQQIITITYVSDTRLSVSAFAIQNASKLNLSDILATNSDLVHRGGSFITGFMNLIYNSIVGFCYLGACFYLSISGSSLSLFLVFVLLFPILLFSNGISTISERITSAWKKSNQVLTDAIRNHLFVTIHGLIREEVELVSSSVNDHRNNFLNFSKMFAFRNAYTPIVGLSVLGLIGVLSAEYKFGINTAVLISFFYIFIRFAQSAGELVNSWGECQLYSDAVKKLDDWSLPIVERKSSSLVSQKIISEIESIEAKNLTFGFNPTQPILENCNLSLKKGDILYIHGESGSGKSTLISLILGILKPSHGQVIVNNIEIEQVGSHMWGLVSYSGPSPLLKQGTLKENLLYGNSNSQNVSDAEINVILGVLGLSGTLKKLDFEIDDNVGLSTGQKQRISIARALLMKPKLLILDEATSNLDKENEQLVIDYLKSIKNEMITIIVSHRDTFKSISNREMELLSANFGSL